MALRLALRSGAVDEDGGFGCLGARGQSGLLIGLGRVAALGHLKARGLRPGDGPNGLRERYAEVPSRARRRIKRGSNPRLVPERAPKWITGARNWVRARGTSWSE